MKTNQPKYKWPTLQDRLNQKPTSRVEALRQLQAVMPLSAAARSELEAAMPEVQLVQITRIYRAGYARVNLFDEFAELEAKLHAQLSEHCRVTGSWVTRRKARIAVSYCGPALSEPQLIRMGHGVLRVMEPD